MNIPLLVRSSGQQQVDRTLKLHLAIFPLISSLLPVSRFGLAVRRQAGERKDLGSIPLRRFSFLFEKVVVCGLSCDFVRHFLLKC